MAALLSRADRQKCGGNGDPVCFRVCACDRDHAVRCSTEHLWRQTPRRMQYASLIKFGVPSLAVASLLYTSPSFDNIQIHLSTQTDWQQIFSALSVGGV